MTFVTRITSITLLAAAPYLLTAQSAPPVGEWRYIGGDVQHTR